VTLATPTGVLGLPTPAAAILWEAYRKERVMNSTVTASARGVNRMDAFLNSQPAGGLHQVNLAELQAVEGGSFPAAASAPGSIVGRAIAAGLVFVVPSPVH
jgi:hypothetical protein